MEPVSSFNLIIGDYSLPLDIQHLDEDAPRLGGSEGRDFSFRFVYRGVPLTGRYRHAGADGQVEVDGDVGPLPFSAESAMARIELKMVLDAANAHLGPLFSVAGGRIHLKTSFPLAYPVTAVGLLSGLVGRLLAIKPYLETIEVFLTPPAEAVKTGSALRPGWRRPLLRRRA